MTVRAERISPLLAARLMNKTKHDFFHNGEISVESRSEPEQYPGDKEGTGS